MTNNRFTYIVRLETLCRFCECPFLTRSEEITGSVIGSCILHMCRVALAPASTIIVSHKVQASLSRLAATTMGTDKV